MSTTNTNKVSLHTTSGLVQKHNSIDEMLAHYNEHGNVYELRTIDGQKVLWHKGQRRIIGEFI